MPKNEKNICPNCEKKVPSNLKFCPICGKKTQLLPICNYCGTEIWPKGIFCIGCGRLRSEALETSLLENNGEPKDIGRRIKLCLHSLR